MLRRIGMLPLARFICFGLVGLLSAAGIVAAQSSIEGPILGFIPDNDGTLIWPIIGVPGASILADPIKFNADVRGAVISPKQNYAIALRPENGEAVVIDLAASGTTVHPISGTRSVAGDVAISPTGSAAAIYDESSSRIQVIGYLPQAPEVIREFSTSSIAGREASLAVSDDGAIVLAKFADAERVRLWVLDSSGVPWPIVLDCPSAAAFLPNRPDVVIIDAPTQSAFLILDMAHRGVRIPLVSALEGIEGFSSVSTSEDGRLVFLADRNSGNIAILDLDTGTSRVLTCKCRIAGLHPLKGSSIFRLTDARHEPVMVLDASTEEPRVVVIPRRPSVEQ